MKLMIRKLIRRIIKALSPYCEAYTDELVMMLVLNTANIALKRDHYVELAPTPGAVGPFKLSGASIPCVEYLCFDKKHYDFIRITVHVSKPEKIEYLSKLVVRKKDPQGKEYEIEGAVVETKDEYKKPFILLLGHLFRYFPYPTDGGFKYGIPRQTVKEVQVPSKSSRAP